ncbi:ArsR/SmtB family transcription factor [Flindersiella endophytica]
MSLEVDKLRAAAHPIRLRMLSLLTGAAMSAAEIARELDISQANASYHMRFLAQAGLVEEAGEEQIRGGVAKRYRHPRGTRVRDAGDDDLEGAFLVWQAIATELIRRAQDVRSGPGAMCDAEMWVTPEIWKQVTEQAAAASRLLHDSAQPPRTEGTIHVNATMALFAMGDDR